MTVRLHIGCGDIFREGFINIDHRQTKATNMVRDCRDLHNISDNSIDVIETYHLIEHLPRLGSKDTLGSVEDALKEWHRVLKQGGKLIIECPDFEEVIKEYFAGNIQRKDNIFGLDRFEGDTHRWGYEFEEIESLLLKAEFTNIVRKEATDYHKESEPCQRVECEKC